MKNLFHFRESTHPPTWRNPLRRKETIWKAPLIGFVKGELSNPGLFQFAIAFLSLVLDQLNSSLVMESKYFY